MSALLEQVLDATRRAQADAGDEQQREWLLRLQRDMQRHTAPYWPFGELTPLQQRTLRSFEDARRRKALATWESRT